MMHIQLLPVYCIAAFGLVSALIVFYRTLTFNDCDAAAEELRSQIQEARTFLEGKGLTVGAK